MLPKELEGLEVREYDRKHRALAFDLAQICLGTAGVPRTQEYWRWKHEDGPFGSSPGIVALEGPRMVGLRLFLRWQWRLGNQSIPAVRPVDTATHPDWRGKKLFTYLTSELVERVECSGVQLIFNTPNAKSRPGYLKMGWREAGKIPVFVRPLRPVRSALRWLGRYERSQTELTAWSENDRPVGDFLDDPRCERLLSKARNMEGRLQTDVSEAHLRWRYDHCPGLEYRAKWNLGDGSMAAVIYRLRARAQLTELSLAEILVCDEEGSVRAGANLIRELLHESDADIATSVAARGTPERRVLLRRAFVPARYFGPRLTVRALGKRLGVDPLQWSVWRPSLGDLELF